MRALFTLNVKGVLSPPLIHAIVDPLCLINFIMIIDCSSDFAVRYWPPGHRNWLSLCYMQTCTIIWATRLWCRDPRLIHSLILLAMHYMELGLDLFEVAWGHMERGSWAQVLNSCKAMWETIQKMDLWLLICAILLTSDLWCNRLAGTSPTLSIIFKWMINMWGTSWKLSYFRSCTG